ncbi:MAG: branched-chain amino acid transport system substrate-binding protein [Mycobacterium sp.]|jgi:ABC-type branched-subunit amino acid transport system substrate-binding protein|nr:branched-chain amino acid transport system substrate-binding protein [Mycobacterium sp.]
MGTKVGICWDFAMHPDHRKLIEDCFQFAFDEAHEQGLLDRPIELIWRQADGLPRGDSIDVVRAWRQLAQEDGCLAIFGPVISDNALSLRTHIEEEGRVPTLSWAASESWPGHWCFALPQGSLASEAFRIANYLAGQGLRRVAVLSERSVIGPECVAAFAKACMREGLTIVAEESIPQTDSDLSHGIARLRDHAPDAIAYFGFGLPAVKINGHLAALGWDPVRVMTTAFLTAPVMPTGWQGVAGWFGMDVYDEENVIGQDFLTRFEAAKGYRPENFLAVHSYDSGRVIAHAISEGHPLSPAGVRNGFEQIRMLPAAAGGPGTLIEFRPHDHVGWLGTDFLVLNGVRNDDGPHSLLGPSGTYLVERYRARPQGGRTR